MFTSCDFLIVVFEPKVVKDCQVDIESPHNLLFNVTIDYWFDYK